MSQKDEVDHNIRVAADTRNIETSSHPQMAGKHTEAQRWGHETEGHDGPPPTSAKTSVYAGLGWLDRLLVVWILLAIIIGILLGNFVEGIGPALQRGKFVDVSVPIGMLWYYPIFRAGADNASGGPARHDVSHTVQGPV